MESWNKNEKQLWNTDEPVSGDCGCTSCGCGTTTEDNACGCTSEARDRVRLTDAEIAKDIIGDLDWLCRTYDCLVKDGCKCQDALDSCERVRTAICKYAKENLY